IMMIILGGMGNFAGAIVGAFAFEVLLHVFKDITKHWQLLMGGFIVLVVVAAPRGLLGMLGQRKGAKAQEDAHHG
ncbi:MAG: branched-chain amino acid ABC transporter permease, partial [Acidovorax sp.]|nr:branched-chain amino acid ABC transporter permease [Acidovorax sp.]